MNRIKDLRNDKDLKQEDLAKKLKISQQTLSNYEAETTQPAKEIWIDIANFFNVSLDYLMGRTNDKHNNEFFKEMTEEEIKELINYKEILKIKRRLEK